MIISSIILLLVPDLRKSSGLAVNFFSAEKSSQSKLSFNQAVNNAGPAVVNVYSESLDNDNYYRRRPVQRTNLGSGVIMNADGHILTCLHVIENAVNTQNNIIMVGLQDGRLVEAQIVGFDELTDLAVLRIAAENLLAVPQQSTSTLVGDVVLAIGNPYNLGQAVSQGIVSRISNNGLNNFFDYIQTDAVLNEGNSGGALVDSEGNLVGIASANFKTRVGRNRIEDVNGVSFAIPYSLAKKVMEEIITNGKVTRGAVGFSSNRPVATNSGIFVTEVTPGGPAEQAGLQIKDIIMSVNGLAASNRRSTLDYITNSTPGTSITLSVIRNGAKLELKVMVSELKIPSL